jgi:hypothetical protein
MGDLGTRLKEWLLRVYGSMYQASLSVGMHPSSLNKYTSGKHLPGSGILIRLAELGCNINWLLTGEGDMFSDSEVGRRHARRLGNDATLGEGASDAPDSTGYAKGLDSPTGRQSLRRQKKGDDQGLGQ